MTTSTSDGAGFQDTHLDVNGIDTMVLTAGAGDPVVFWLHRIDVRSPLLWGEADRLVSFAQAAVWAAAMPRATIKSFPGAGHLLFEERPDAAAALVEFFRA